MSQLQVDLTGLSEHHIRALQMFIDKFIAGAREHGDLEPGKDWTPDMLYEEVDRSFYTIFMLLDRMKE